MAQWSKCKTKHFILTLHKFTKLQTPFNGFVWGMFEQIRLVQQNFVEQN